MSEQKEHQLPSVDCNFCGATGEVWHRSEVKLIECPVCKGKGKLEVGELYGSAKSANFHHID